MRTRVFAIGAMMITMTLAAGCGADDADSPDASGASPSTAAVAAPAAGGPGGSPATAASGLGTVTVGMSAWGPVLTDDKGRTLYGFTSDTDGASSCTGACATTWPPLIDDAPTAGTGAESSMIGETNRSDGTSQVVYGKWPLYRFSGDVEAGDVKGQGIGGMWYVVAPNGKLIKMVG
jgi:predicted lipoprotein with Yx(FWY)xxD motif